MSGETSLVDEIEALVPLHLEGLREIWRDRFGAPPKALSCMDAPGVAREKLT